MLKKNILTSPLCLSVSALSFVPRRRRKHYRFRPRGRLGRPHTCTSIHLCSRPSRFELVQLGGDMCSNCQWEVPGGPRPTGWWYQLVLRTIYYVYEYIWYEEVTGSPVAQKYYVWIHECVRTPCEVRMAYPGGYTILCRCCCCCCCCCCLHITTHLVRVVIDDDCCTDERTRRTYCL